MSFDTKRSADFLAELRVAQREIDTIPSSSRPPDLESAYTVQDALVKRLLEANGGEQIGYKIACTSDIAQRLLRVAHPLFGQTLSFSSFPSPALFSEREFRVCIIEAEFSFQIGQDVPRQESPYDADSIRPFVEAILPSIEIIDHRFADWSTVGAPSIAADNAMHGAWVYGDAKTDWHEIDLRNHNVMLTVNDEVVSKGSGEAVLGHPLNALAWLANELPKYGKGLVSGEVITTGVCMDVYTAKAGDNIVADFGLIGKIEVKVH